MSKALLLIDIQNDYFPGGKCELSEPEKALENAFKALTIFRSRGLPVIHVQHINTQKGAAFFLPDTHGAGTHEALSPAPDEDVIIKHVPNSFYKTNLHEIIIKKGISELIVCGMMTHMCIDTTVRAAMDYLIPVTLIHDACATKDLCWGETVLPAQDVSNVYFAGLNKMFAKIIPIHKLCL